MQLFRLQKVYLSNVFDAKFVNVFSPMMTCAGICGLCLSMFLIVLIICKSGPTMGKFKNYLLAYTLCCSGLEVLMLLYKPYVILPFGIIYPLGVIDTDAKTTFILIILTVVMCVWINIFVTLMMIERYFAMSYSLPGPGNYFKFDRKTLFITYFLSLGTVFIITSIVVVVWYPTFTTAEETAEIIREYIINGEELLAAKPSLTCLKTDTSALYFVFVLAFLSIFQISLFQSILIYKSFNFISALSRTLIHRNVRQNHVMLLKVTLYQTIGFSFLIIFPAFVLLLAFTLGLPSSVVAGCVFCMSFFPITDNLVTLVVIKPYRQSVTHVFARAIHRKRANATVAIRTASATV